MQQREADFARRSHATNTFNPLKLHRQRMCDLIFDRLRPVPRPFRVDEDLVFLQVRHVIDRRLQDRDDAPHG